MKDNEKVLQAIETAYSQNITAKQKGELKSLDLKNFISAKENNYSVIEKVIEERAKQINLEELLTFANFDHTVGADVTEVNVKTKSKSPLYFSTSAVNGGVIKQVVGDDKKARVVMSNEMASVRLTQSDKRKGITVADIEDRLNEDIKLSVARSVVKYLDKVVESGSVIEIEAVDFDTDGFDQAISKVKKESGTVAVDIYGTQSALNLYIQDGKLSDKMKDELNDNGYLGKYKGSNVFNMDNLVVALNQEDLDTIYGITSEVLTDETILLIPRSDMDGKMLEVFTSINSPMLENAVSTENGETAVFCSYTLGIYGEAHKKLGVVRKK